MIEYVRGKNQGMEDVDMESENRTPPHAGDSSSRRARDLYAEIVAKAVKVRASQWFRKYVRNIVFRANTRDRDIASKDTFAHEVILDSNMLGVGMPDMVF